MADDDPRGQTIPVIPSPPELMDERSQEEARVRDPPGDHHIRALVEGVNDPGGAKINGRCEQPAVVGDGRDGVTEDNPDLATAQSL